MRTLAALSLFLLVPASVLARVEPHRWPLDEPRRISSTFEEYRDAHYHAGLDLRTFGRIGLPCLAPDSCEVARLRVSPIGYGKAVYVRFADGSTAVFAHLDGFSRSLDSLAYVWRLARKKNSCDIEVAPGLIRFRRGETIGYTGSTGSPHPHLHFEMRDTAGRPFNPLMSLYEVPDACAPILSALEVVPLSWGSLVNGSPLAWTGRLRLERDNRYALADTLRLDGLFGFGADAYDKQVRGSYRMGPYSYELFIDGASAYRVLNTRFDYARVGDIPLEYEERGGNAPGRYLVLFKRPANAMPDRSGVGIVTNHGAGASALTLADGPHQGEIVVRDAAGNEARARFRFVMGPCRAPEAAAVAAGADSPGVRCDVRPELRAEGLYLRIRTDRPLASAPSVRLRDGAGGDSLGVFGPGPREFAAFAPVDRLGSGERAFEVRGTDCRGYPFDEVSRIRIFTFTSGGSASFDAASGVAVRLMAPSVRGTAALILGEGSPPAGAHPELEPVGEPFVLDYPPAGYARPLQCAFDAGRSTGLFRWEGRAGWRCIGVPALTAGSVDVRRPGKYALFRDSTPPLLTRLAVSRSHREGGYFRKTLYYIPVHERGSGVDAESAAAFLDGERVVCEYDEYRARLMVPVPRSRPGGPAKLRVELSDRAGNSTAAEFTCVIE